MAYALEEVGVTGWRNGHVGRRGHEDQSRPKGRIGYRNPALWGRAALAAFVPCPTCAHRVSAGFPICRPALRLLRYPRRKSHARSQASISRTLLMVAWTREHPVTIGDRAAAIEIHSDSQAPGRSMRKRTAPWCPPWIQSITAETSSACTNSSHRSPQESSGCHS